MTDVKGSLWLKLELKSDAAFGRGDGVAGLVDAEVQHDSFGLPYLGGKTLKGLLAAECAEILDALSQVSHPDMSAWENAARFLFGSPGSRAGDIGCMIVGNAQLPDDLRQRIQADFRPLYAISEGAKREQAIGHKQRMNLESLTALRRQTAVDETSGTPKENTLRTIRVIIRGVTFTARLDFTEPIPDHARWLLAACVQAFHRAGTSRNRGYGRLRATLYKTPTATAPTDWFTQFVKEVQA
jgi:CRISPR/Cas system CSM-associated protein Csm3 (group 7 of RAMP superfamily)